MEVIKKTVAQIMTTGTTITGGTIIIPDLTVDYQFKISLTADMSNIGFFDAYEQTTEPTIDVPTVSTTTLSAILQTTATGGGNVNYDGGSPVTARGVIWDIAANPTIALLTKTSDGDGTGIFTSSLSGLVANTFYYVRAYATNAIGTGYGNQLQITTAGVLQLAALTVDSVTVATSTTAIGYGTITDGGGSSVFQRGFVWKLNSIAGSPTLSDSFTNDGSTGIGAFASPMSTGMAAGQTYKIRAYAINGNGTAYSSNELTFSTSVTIPLLTTNPISNIAATSATSGGEITSAGGGTITARGIVWDTNGIPTIENNIGMTAAGTGTGSFTANMTGLIAGTHYYVKAYATNEAGTNYADYVGFTATAVPINAMLSLSFISIPSSVSYSPHQRVQATLTPAINGGSITITEATVQGYYSNGLTIPTVGTIGVHETTVGITIPAGNTGPISVKTDQDPDNVWDSATGYAFSVVVKVNGQSISLPGTSINVGSDTVNVQFPTSCVHF